MKLCSHYSTDVLSIDVYLECMKNVLRWKYFPQTRISFYVSIKIFNIMLIFFFELQFLKILSNLENQRTTARTALDTEWKLAKATHTNTFLYLEIKSEPSTLLYVQLILTPLRIKKRKRKLAFVQLIFYRFTQHTWLSWIRGKCFALKVFSLYQNPLFHPNQYV